MRATSHLQHVVECDQVYHLCVVVTGMDIADQARDSSAGLAAWRVPLQARHVFHHRRMHIKKSRVDDDD